MNGVTIFNVEWVETKAADWKVATIIEGVEGGKTYENVSINRAKRDGSEPFPNFDDIAPGSTINGNLWLNPTSQKYSLFPLRPKPAAPAAGGRGPGFGVKAAQERKAADIATAQENKGHAIKVAAAMRDSTMLAIAAVEGSHFETVEEREEALIIAHSKFKKWYLAQWSEVEKSLEVPF